MKILIPTVPHSGTHLIHDMFVQAGFESAPIQNRHTGNTVTTTHIDRDERLSRVLSMMNEYQAVTPIRHPYLVEESWRRREQPLDRLYATYRRLPALHEAGALIVPVDSPERDKYIKRINKSLGINLKPDWKTVVNGYHNTHNMTYKDVKPSDEIKKLTQELSFFLSNYYEDIMVEEKPPRKKREKINKDDEFIEVIALRKMMNDQTQEMAEPGDTVMKMRKDARIMQDAGTIKLPI